MVRRRYHVSWHDTWEEASKAKGKLKETSPDKEYQIRSKSKGFEVVERLSTTEAEVVREIRYGAKHGSSKRSKRGSVPVL